MLGARLHSKTVTLSTVVPGRMRVCDLLGAVLSAGLTWYFPALRNVGQDNETFHARLNVTRIPLRMSRTA